MKITLKIIAVAMCAMMLLSAFASCKKKDENKPVESGSSDVTDTAADSDTEDDTVGETETDTEKKDESESVEETDTESSEETDVEETKEDTKETDTEEIEETDENGYLVDGLPETYDWKGKQFTVFTWDEMDHWEWCEELTDKSGTVDYALYKRMKSVEDRFKIKFKIVREAGKYDKRTDFVSKLYDSISTGQKTYDLVGQYTQAAGGAATQNLYVDLNSVDYLDLSKPWWPSSISETTTIGDKLYFTTGDITPTLIRNIHCMYVNEAIYESEKIGETFAQGRSMYEVVKDGDWTLELLMQMGIGTVGDAGDTIGISFANDVSADAYYFGADFRLLDNDNGILTISDDLVSVDLINVYEKIQKMYSGQFADVKIESGDHDFKFREGNVLFTASTIAEAQTYTDKELEYSILPMPMRDKDQEGGYKTVANFWVTMYSIPVDVENTDFSGMIMEALASEAYRSVTDVIYYDVFAARFTEDIYGAELLDIVSDSVVFDSGRMFPDFIGNIWAAFRIGVVGSDAWTTIYANNSQAWSIKIESLYTLLG